MPQTHVKLLSVFFGPLQQLSLAGFRRRSGCRDIMSQAQNSLQGDHMEITWDPLRSAARLSVKIFLTMAHMAKTSRQAYSAGMRFVLPGLPNQSRMLLEVFTGQLTADDRNPARLHVSKL